MRALSSVCGRCGAIADAIWPRRHVMERESLWNRFRLEFQHLKLFKYKSLATYATFGGFFHTTRITSSAVHTWDNVYKPESVRGMVTSKQFNGPDALPASHGLVWNNHNLNSFIIIAMLQHVSAYFEPSMFVLRPFAKIFLEINEIKGISEWNRRIFF